MQSDIAWLAPEQEGPASALLSRAWRTQQELERAQATSRLRSVPDVIDQCQPAAGGGSAAPPPARRRPADGRDRSCTVDYDERRAELVGANGGCPWLVQGKVYKTGVAGLHEEIEDFFVYMSPIPEEHQMRTQVYNSIRNVIIGLWPQADVFIFGSFETGLYLPTSDIDVVVMGNWENALEILRDALIRADICDPTAIKVLDKAAVPIIKLTDRRTEVKVDIGFNMNNGLVSACQIKQYQVEYPHMPKLVIVLKQFLLQRDLNEVFTGGISSYSLILMTVGFLQTHDWKLTQYSDCIFGILLIEFFEHYGFKFNYLKTCIKVKDRGYAPRSQVEEQFSQYYAHNSPLCIEDPHNASNDIGRSSYNMMKVKEAFKYAYQRLSSAVFSPDSACDPNRCSLLGRVVRITDRVIEYRNSVRHMFSVPQRAASYSPHSSSSPLSSATSDASDQDVEGCDQVPGRRPTARDTSPAGRGPGAGRPPPQQHHPPPGLVRRHHANGHGQQHGPRPRRAPAGGDAVSLAGGPIHRAMRYQPVRAIQHDS